MAAAVFPLIPRRRVIGLAFGVVRSARRGPGSDVASTREYRPGDDLAWMDWAASAKLSAARGDDEFVVRERYADEAPRVVALCDRRPSMSLAASEVRPLDKPAALAGALELIEASAVAARSLTGYLDYGDGEAYWHPPRTSGRAAHDAVPRPFRAPADTVSRGLEFLAERRRDLPTQAFVFVLSDFLVPPDLRAWERALEHRWELVPVIVQDPAWERSFPDVGGIAVPYADAGSGRVHPVYLSRREAAAQQRAHEARWDRLVRGFRSLGAEPVVVHAHGPVELLESFLHWADLRLFWRGALP